MFSWAIYPRVHVCSLVPADSLSLLITYFLLLARSLLLKVIPILITAEAVMAMLHNSYAFFVDKI